MKCHNPDTRYLISFITRCWMQFLIMHLLQSVIEPPSSSVYWPLDDRWQCVILGCKTAIIIN